MEQFMVVKHHWLEIEILFVGTEDDCNGYIDDNNLEISIGSLEIHPVKAGTEIQIWE